MSDILDELNGTHRETDYRETPPASFPRWRRQSAARSVGSSLAGLADEREVATWVAGETA